MDLVEELDDPRIPIVQACAALGISRATLYRKLKQYQITKSSTEKQALEPVTQSY